MRYLKVLLVVLLFFMSMVFLFQNQPMLATEMKLNLNLYFIKPMESIALPFYFLLLAAFLLGSIMTMTVLIWDKINLSARNMKATWRVRALEKEVAALRANQAQPIALTPKSDQEDEKTVEIESNTAPVEVAEVEKAKEENVKEESVKEEAKSEEKPSEENPSGENPSGENPSGEKANTDKP